MKTLAASFTILLILSISLIILRQHEYKIYQEYNVRRGTVISTFKSESCYISTVRLSNGIIGTINSGYHEYKRGDIFINDINFSWIGGITGLAYCIVPGETKFIILNAVLTTCEIVGILLFCVYLFICIYENEFNITWIIDLYKSNNIFRTIISFIIFVLLYILWLFIEPSIRGFVENITK